LALTWLLALYLLDKVKMMQKWGYKIIKNNGLFFNADEMTQRLNQFGEEGWEVCGCFLEGNTGEVVILKRPRE